MRRNTRSVLVGVSGIGGNSAISVQSMTNTDTRDVVSTVQQIHCLEDAGCDIVRCSVYNAACAEAIRAIRAQIRIPLVADIHFDYRLAVAAMENGVDKLRFNPGNIGSDAHVQTLVDAAKMHHTPIRIGVNGGSLEKELRAKYGGATPEAMVESALRHVRLLERQGFSDIVISLKASTVRDTVEAYRKMSETVDYPLHVGITETGSVEQGIIKSAVGIGALLLDGIGDTIRVSLTDDPVQEVLCGKRILRSLHLLSDDIELVSCPTCGRTRVDLMHAMREVDRRLPHNCGYLKVAVMGCAVNGPGEAQDADIGIAFGDGNGVIFKNGTKWISGDMPGILDVLIKEAEQMLSERNGENKT